MSETKRVAFVGIDDTSADGISRALGAGYEIERCAAERAIERIGNGSVDACVVNIAEGASYSEDVARAARTSGTVEVVILADTATRDRALDAVVEGAFCFLLHPIDADQVARMVVRATESSSRRERPIVEPVATHIGGNGSDASKANGFVPPAGLTLEEIERATIYQALKRTRGNKQAAANALGIYRPRLYSKIKKYNMTEFM